MTARTSSTFVERLRKSGLVPASTLDAAIERAGSESADDLVRLLIAESFLTRFQADRLLAGKYKGFRLGPYTIRDRLGSGGMGQVYLAEHEAMRRQVALKVLMAGHENDVARHRFLREARAAATLDHPNIVRIFDLDRDGSPQFLVMEYIDGPSLQDLVSGDGPLPIARAVDLAVQVANGLQHAHDRGFVHRDIKPANILVDRAGVARILDFGLVRETADTDSQLTGQLGNLGSILGTADYLAPEQAVDSSQVDIRADVYSLAATLYFLLSGHTLFPAAKTGQKLMWQQWREPVPLAEHRPDLPPGLPEIVHKALAKDRTHRHATPAEFAAALAPFGLGRVPESKLRVRPHQGLIGHPTPPPLQVLRPTVAEVALDTLSDHRPAVEVPQSPPMPEANIPARPGVSYTVAALIGIGSAILAIGVVAILLAFKAI